MNSGCIEKLATSASISDRDGAFGASAAASRIVRKIVASLENEPAKLSSFRADFEAIASEAHADNAMRFPFLMTRATKL